MLSRLEVLAKVDEEGNAVIHIIKHVGNDFQSMQESREEMTIPGDTAVDWFECTLVPGILRKENPEISPTSRIVCQVSSLGNVTTLYFDSSFAFECDTFTEDDEYTTRELCEVVQSKCNASHAVAGAPINLSTLQDGWQHTKTDQFAYFDSTEDMLMVVDGQQNKRAKSENSIPKGSQDGATKIGPKKLFVGNVNTNSGTSAIVWNPNRNLLDTHHEALHKHMQRGHPESVSSSIRRGCEPRLSVSCDESDMERVVNIAPTTPLGKSRSVSCPPLSPRSVHSQSTCRTILQDNFAQPRSILSFNKDTKSV